MTKLNAYDYIIVGAGSASCMLAKRLTENLNKRVLLIEAGKNDNCIWIHIPVGYLVLAKPKLLVVAMLKWLTIPSASLVR